MKTGKKRIRTRATVLGTIALSACLVATALAPAHGQGKGKTGGGGPKQAAACNDHLDNDGDGFCDFSSKNAYCLDGSALGDPDCSSKDDDTEACTTTNEACDGLDNDCDGLVDEDAVCLTNYYCDRDGDSYRSAIPSGSCSTAACVPTECSTQPGPDCDDDQAHVGPGTTESCDSDGLDNDCDGLVDECDPCLNGLRDGNESDIDCGGSCATCPKGAACGVNADCTSGTCQSGTCVVPPTDLDPSCRPLKYDGTLDNRVNLIFVPSGFAEDMTKFASEVGRIADLFASFEPFGPSAPAYNILYVPEEAGSYCNFNCNGIARLLCCSTSLARSLSSTCTGGARQTIVVHNSTTYGGAGYTSTDVATTSIHSSAPRIAVHELGHSLFNLSDEYDSSASLVSGSMNCDGSSACSRWSDMLGYNGVDCRPQSCANASYWASESTLMRSLSYPFEEVNLRATCCAYHRETGSFPGYCTQFEQFPSSQDLVAYCAGGSGSVGSVSGSPETVERLEAPEELELVLQGSGKWKLASVTPRPPGFYRRDLVYGDGTGSLAVDINLASGARRRLRFSDTAPVEFPGETTGMGGYVDVPRETLTILVDAKKHGRTIGVWVSRQVRR